jgi:WD40 repeat protein
LRDGRPVLASGSDDAQVLLWDPETGASFPSPPAEHTRPVLAVAIGRLGDGRVVLASAGGDSRVLLHELDTPERARRALAGHTGTVRALTFAQHDTGRMALVSAGDDATVRLWNPDPQVDPRYVALQRIAPSNPSALCSAPGTLIVGCGDGIVALAIHSPASDS